jgi:GDPmannose 4,6-dehydratase
MKRALITGIGGQDGSYLAEHLLETGYEVHGLIRRNSVPEHQESRLSHITKDVFVYYADMNDVTGIERVLNKVQPEVIYNLAAQSHVRISFEIPNLTSQINAMGTLNILELIRNNNLKSKFYQASSSEMFGSSVDPDGFQRETTPMNPVSPYGCAKLFAYHLTRNYRDSYSLFCSNGVLFNHESPRRGSNFVTSKVIKTAVEIKLGLKKDLVLGNLDSHRDWGHSYDYVRAMKLIMDHDEPDDFVVSTGITRSVRDLLKIVFTSLDLNYEQFVKQDEKYLRPKELPYLKGDSSKIRSILGWKPVITFEEMIIEMVKFWYDTLSQSKKI